MNYEGVHNGEQAHMGDDSPWGESYQKDLPPFNPDRKEDRESGKNEVSGRDVAEKMLEVSDGRQGEYVDWLNEINEYGSSKLQGEAASEYDKFLEEQHLVDGAGALERWREELESSLENLQKQDELVIKGLEDLERPENAGKTFDQILAGRAKESQRDIESLVGTGAWDNVMTDAQREMHMRKRDGFQNLAEWASQIRDELEQEVGAEEGVLENKLSTDVHWPTNRLEDLITETPERLDDLRLKRIVQGARNAAMVTEDDYYRYVKSVARREAVPYDELLTEVRERTKASRFGKSKNKVKFYHSTSLDGLSGILDSGGKLLSRSKRRERGEDISKLPWSSSENVQFSCDQFNDDGELVKSGFGMGRGASGSEITFVFDGDLIDEASFDAAFEYPTVEEADLPKKCLGIVVKDASNIDAVRALLRQSEIDIPVYTAESYDSKISSQELRRNKAVVAEGDALADGQNSEGEEVFTPSEEKLMINSEAEMQAICGAFEAIRPNIEQLLGISKGSFSMEQASAYLFTASDKMENLSVVYMGVLENAKDVAELKQYAAGYDEEMRRYYGNSVNAIESIRRKAQILPIALKGPILQHCQKIENTLASVMSTVKYKDNKMHDIPMEKRKIDDKELEGIFKEEISARY